MANKRIWLGMLTLALVFGMVLVGCDDGSTSYNNNTSSNVPKELVGEWYVDADLTQKYCEIKSNGKLVLGDDTENYAIEIKDGDIIIFLYGGSRIEMYRFHDYKVDGNKLTATYMTGPVTYYKK